MFLDFELFYSRPRFNERWLELSDSQAHHIDRPWHVTRCCAAGAPVLDDDDWPSDAMSRCRWWHHHSTRFPRRARTDFQISSDITRHVFLVEHELISWCHHSTRFPRRARTDFLMSSLDTFSSSSTNFETKSTSLFKGLALVDPRSSSFACDVHLLPGPGPALTSAAISDKFVVAFLRQVITFGHPLRNRRTFPGCGLHPLRTTTLLTWILLYSSNLSHSIYLSLYK